MKIHKKCKNNIQRYSSKWLFLAGSFRTGCFGLALLGYLFIPSCFWLDIIFELAVFGYFFLDGSLNVMDSVCSVPARGLEVRQAVAFNLENCPPTRLDANPVSLLEQHNLLLRWGMYNLFWDWDNKAIIQDPQRSRMFTNRRTPQRKKYSYLVHCLYILTHRSITMRHARNIITTCIYKAKSLQQISRLRW